MSSNGRDDPPPDADAAHAHAHAQRIAEWSSDVETEAAPLRIEEAAGASEEGSGRMLLVVREGDDVRVVDLEPGGVEIVIGRAPDAAVQVVDKQVSRAHASLHYDGYALRLRDRGSRNGTVVNGRVLTNAECTLASGDSVGVGACRIVVASVKGQAVPSPIAAPGPDDDLVVADPEMAAIYESARKVARAPTSVLLLGETGVGKDVLAQRIHRWSPRADKPFIRVNCAALPETLLESELFGHERGAFTGADKKKIGYFEAALGGTIFIDEVGEMPLPAQVKLLNVLETRTITRVGGTQAIPIDVRVISATNREPHAEVAAGRFRSDLFYRISAFTLRIPPLRSRPGQILLLARVFARALAAELGEEPPSFAQDALDVLLKYSWPGNVRELRNAVEHALVMAEGGVLLAEHFSQELRGSASPLMSASGAATAPANRPNPNPNPNPNPALDARERAASAERKRIEEALDAEGGNQTRAAQRLGMPRRTLVYKLARYRRGE
jgi:two-component system response regulator AtoC